MRNISIGNLFDLVETHHIIRNAREMWWTHDWSTNMEVLCNGYMIWRVALPADSSTMGVIRKRFNDREPLDDMILHSVKARKRYDVSESQNRDSLLQCLHRQGKYTMIDTGITADIDDCFDPDKRQIHAFCVACADHSEYVFINQKYRDCIYQPDNISAVEPKRSSPLVFESKTSDERAVILPIVSELPMFLAPLN